MDEKQILQSLLTGIFSLTDGEIAELLYSDGKLKDNADELVLERHAKKVEKTNQEKQKFFDNGYSKGKKESMERVEKTFKETTGADGEDFDSMLSAYQESHKGKSKASDDDIKRHPLFLDLERNSVKKDQYEAIVGEFDNYKRQETRRNALRQVQQKAWDLTASKNPVLSDNPTVAETRKNDFLTKFEAYDYELVEDMIVVVKDGKRLEDKHGNVITFDNHVNGIASSCFDFKKQSDKGNAGNQGNPQGSSGVPKDENEYRNALSTEADPQKRIDIMNAWKARQG